MYLLKLAVIAVVAYAIGDINPAIIIGRLHGIDIRKEGSGNAGMTNTIRVIGLGAGISVFAIDVLKAFIAVKAGIAFAGDAIGGMVAFFFVVLGHVYPAYYGFKGGKGVAASLGAVIALNWQSALGVLAVAGVLFLISRRKMSVASLCAAMSYPVFIWFLVPDRRYFYFACFMAVFLIANHASNIRRIARGEEESLTIGHADEHTSGTPDNDNNEIKEGSKE